VIVAAESWSVELLHDPAEALSRAGPWLAGHAIDANVIGSALAATLAGPAAARAVLPWPLVLDAGGQVAGLAMLRPGHGLFVPELPPGAAEAVAAELFRHGADPPEVSGEDATAQAFAVAWHGLTGRGWEPAAASQVYVLDTLVPPLGVPGSLRVATPADVDRVTAWAEEFMAEAEGALGPPGGERDVVTRRIAAREIALWEVDADAVSMAATSPAVGGVARVNLVYTPPAERGRGYGAAVSAGVTRRALADGADTCMLYADVANDTSNGIYRRIGYRAFASSVVLRFT
jgi:GNAT superfamily N-acetyltransferase